ncbi:hypothetical protein J2W14_003447, partial [Pseudarthrobacter oxydans]|nr:hypothetical protein [Pseudarthrobacter oxydans]
SKDKPPGWTSPSGRYYPSEQQDWEPPDWPPNILKAGEGFDEEGPPAHPGWDPDLDLPAHPGWDPDLDLPAHRGWDPDVDAPPDPGRDPNLELPPDPFPDWYLFAAGHQFPAAVPADPPWPAPLKALSRDVI